MAKPFVVSLVCTRDDLLDLREVIKGHLTQMGYSMLAFDEADYPYVPNRDLGEQSVALANHPDVLLLILDRRYGTRLPNNLSVTENEWQNAQRSKAPFIVPCVRGKTIAEFEQWRAGGGAWVPGYVDDVALLRFIERVRTQTTFVLEFDSAEDLLAKLDRKMRSLTPFVLRRVADASRDNAGNKRTVTVVDQTLSLGDVFARDLYVTPPYRLLSGRLPRCNLETGAVRCLKSRQSMIITGGPGTGKSTTLVKSLCRRSADMEGNALLAPIYVDCHSLSLEDFASVQALFAKLFRLALDKDIWPHFDQNDANLQVELFFDALDEVRDGTTALEQVMAGSPVWSWCHNLLTCRSDFLSRVLGNPSTSGRYQYIAELQPWDVQHMKSYIKRKFGDDRQRADEMIEIISSEPFHELARNVIGLVMLCSLDNVSLVDNAATLYRAFLVKWATREACRVGTSPVDENMILSVWQRIAWKLLTSGRNGGVTISLLPDTFGRYDTRRDVVCSPVVRSLLMTSSPSDDPVVAGFVHDSIYEYLLAAELIEQLKGRLHQQMEALEQDTWYQVNEFAQLLMSKWNERDCLCVVSNLITAYENRLNDCGCRALLLRNKASYYIGRLGRQSPLASSRAFGFLDKAWKEEPSPFVRQSIGFARSIAGRPNAVVDFINEMRGSSELDSLNRGYHLVYYGDIKAQNPPYRDSDQGSWQQTHRALIDRFKRHSTAKRNSRAVDLYTFRGFLETRQEKLTTEETEVVLAILKHLDSYPADLRPTIENECSEVIKLAG